VYNFNGSTFALVVTSCSIRFFVLYWNIYIHSFIQDISIAPLQVHYNSVVFTTTA